MPSARTHHSRRSDRFRALSSARSTRNRPRQRSHRSRAPGPKNTATRTALKQSSLTLAAKFHTCACRWPLGVRGSAIWPQRVWLALGVCCAGRRARAGREANHAKLLNICCARLVCSTWTRDRSGHWSWRRSLAVRCRIARMPALAAAPAEAATVVAAVTARRGVVAAPRCTSIPGALPLPGARLRGAGRARAGPPRPRRAAVGLADPAGPAIGRSCRHLATTCGATE
jgi:hypothetical protein